MNNGKICVSICAENAEEMLQQIRRAEEFADVIELRFDCLNHLQFKIFLTKLIDIRQKFLITFRPEEYGGNRQISLSERRRFWQTISSFENAVFFDVEPDLQKKFTTFRFDKRIASFHNFTENASDVEQIYCELSETKSPVIKIAVRADDITDSISVWKLLEKAKSENKQIIPIAMGEAGKWTRILGLAHDAFLTYASLDAGKETASGQISAKDLIETYRVKELDESTEIYGILGNPVSQSVSPFMRNAAFKLNNLNCVFIPFEVKNLDEFIKRLVRPETHEIELNFRGFSVTAPHKQAIIKHLDLIDETAEQIGAVNTVKIENGKLRGFNTDAKGFIEPLKTAYGDLRAVKVAILGASGAARACIYALKKESAKVTVFARDLAKAKTLATAFEVELKDFANADFNDFDILVNTTPVGMKSKSENETPVFAEQIERVKLVYDLVYNPFETRLMCEAKKANVPVIGGLAMLAAQGAEQSVIWTGKDAPLKEVSRAALRRLK